MCHSRESHDEAPCCAISGPTTATPLSTRRPLIPLALSMVIQRRTAALCSSFGDADAIAESRPEKDIRVREQTVFDRDDDKLRPTEPCAEERANMLRAREVQCCVDLIGDVLRRGLEFQQRHNQR